jgi:hypothetical protein
MGLPGYDQTQPREPRRDLPGVLPQNSLEKQSECVDQRMDRASRDHGHHQDRATYIPLPPLPTHDRQKPCVSSTSLAERNHGLPSWSLDAQRLQFIEFFLRHIECHHGTPAIVGVYIVDRIKHGEVKVSGQ